MSKEYYIVSIKHTSKGDSALTFWGANGGGYCWGKERAGVYPEETVGQYCDGQDAVKVDKELVDKFWMNAIDFGDKYVAVANTKQVLLQLGLSDRYMKPKKYATCRMAFMNTPVTV